MGEYNHFCPETGGWYQRIDNEDGSVSMLGYRSLIATRISRDQYDAWIASGHLRILG